MGGVLEDFRLSGLPGREPGDPWVLHRLLWTILTDRLEWELYRKGCRDALFHYMLEEYDEHYGDVEQRAPDAAATSLRYRFKDYAGTCAVWSSASVHWFTMLAAMHHHTLALAAEEHGYTLHPPQRSLVEQHLAERTIRLVLRDALYEVYREDDGAVSLISDVGDGEHPLSWAVLSGAEQEAVTGALRSGRCQCDFCAALPKRIRCHRPEADIFQDLDGTPFFPEQVITVPNQTPGAPLSPTLQFTRCQHLPWVWSVAFSPDGALLALGGENGRLELRDASGGAVLWADRLAAGASVQVAFTRDGRLGVVEYFDSKNDRFQLLDPRTRARFVQQEIVGDLLTWDLHPRLPWLAVPRHALDLKLLHLDTGEQICPVDQDTGLRRRSRHNPHLLQFSSDGRWLYSNNPHWIRDVRSGRVRFAFAEASAAVLHPTDPDLIALSRHGALILYRLGTPWDPLRDAVLLPEPLEDPYIGDLQWSADGEWVVSAWDGGQVFSATQRRWLGAFHTDTLMDARVHPQRRFIAAIDESDGLILYAVSSV